MSYPIPDGSPATRGNVNNNSSIRPGHMIGAFVEYENNNKRN